MRTFTQAITNAIESVTQTKGGNNDPRFSLLAVEESASYYTGGLDGEVVSTGDPVHPERPAYGVSVAHNGETIYVCWESGGTVYLATRSGGVWSTQTIATNAKSNKGFCSVAVVDGLPAVAYIDTSSYLYYWRNGSATRVTTSVYYGARIAVFGSSAYIVYVNSSGRLYYAYNNGSWRTVSVSTAHSYTDVTISYGLNENELNIYGLWSGSDTNTIEYIRYIYTGSATMTKTDTVAGYAAGTRFKHYADFKTEPVIVDGVVVVPAKAVQYSYNGVRVGNMTESWKDVAWGAWTPISVRDGATVGGASGGYIVGSVDEQVMATHTYKVYLFDFSNAAGGGNLTPYFIGGTINQTNGSAITQFNCNLLPSAFSLVNPGTALMASMSFGTTGVIPLGTFYVDEVSYSALSDSVSVSARNAVGYLLASGTYGFGATYSSQTPNEAVDLILSAAGVQNYTVQNLPSVSTSWVFAEGASLLDDITKTIGARVLTLNVYETPSGEVVVGTDAWIANNYKAVGTYNYADGTLFTRQIRKSIDPVYSRLLASSGVSGIVPSTQDVPVFDGWKTPYKSMYEHVSGSITTQADFDAFVADLLARLQLAGHTESYTSPIRPQLEVGDIAQYNGQTIGIVTQVSHSFGKDGFKTNFSVDSGGAIADESGTTVTKTRGINGYTRRQNLADLMRKIAKE